MFGLFMQGFANLLTLGNLAIMVLGLVIGIVFGAIPGLNSVIAISLCLPITFTMNIYSSMLFLLALYIGATSGGLISAILINIPGTTASVATCYDGHPLAKKGQAFKALGVGIVFSFFGTLFGIGVLVFCAPTLSNFALHFSPFDYFSVLLFSISLIGVLSSESMLKGLIAGIFGIFLSCVGIAPIDGFVRFTFGFHELDAGFSLVPTIVGFFVIPEIIKAAQDTSPGQKVEYKIEKVRGFGFSIREMLGQTKNFLIASVIGTGIGILPGIGGNVANLLSYAAVKKTSKYPEKFGTGVIDGVVASETANNAVCGGAMLPLLTLGIPGDGSTSILLGALIIQGFTPGPTLLETNPILIYTIFAAMILCSFGMLLIELPGIRLFVKVLKVPTHILMPFILVLCAVGAISINGRVFDVWLLFIMGLFGYVLDFGKFPRAPMALGFVLGSLVETQLRSAMQLGHNSIVPFFTHPTSLVFILVTAGMLASMAYSQFASARKRKVLASD